MNARIMFRPSDIVIEAFVDHLEDEYRRTFPGGVLEHSHAIARSARVALGNIARSNALYHDLSHTILVTQIGQNMLQGRILRSHGVSSSDWMHFIISTLCFATGFVRDICPGDDGKGNCVVDAAGGTVALPRGATDGWLWPYFTDRSKLFVAHHFRDDPVVDWRTLAANIEYSRFPALPDRNRETASYPGLLRAAHLIGSIADPDFDIKTKSLLVELEESGMTKLLGYSDIAAFRAGFHDLFWLSMYPLIADGMKLLDLTGEGRELVAHLHAHLLIENNVEPVHT
jgi:hypothetical protein